MNNANLAPASRRNNRKNRKNSRRASRRNNRRNNVVSRRNNRRQCGGASNNKNRGAGFFTTRLTGPAADIVNAVDRVAGKEVEAIANTTRGLLHSGLGLVSKTLSYAGEGANNTVRSAVRVVTRKNRKSRKNRSNNRK
jgi:hypothetical protein